MKVNITSFIRNAKFLNLPDKIDFLHFDLKDTATIFKQEYLSEKLQSAAGEVTIKEYLKYPYFHLKTEFTQDDKEKVNEKDVVNIIHANSSHLYNNLEMFIMCLWFIKDNSTFLGGFHTYMPSINYLINISIIDSIYCDSSGKYNHGETYSIDELNRTLKFFVKYNEAINHSSVKLLPKNQRTPPLQSITTIPYNFTKITRIERAIHFLKLARTSTQLHLKISFYICIYESLFSSSTEKTEITHTICERVALYYGFNPSHRKGIYTQLKEAYGIRSTYFHGQSFDTKKYRDKDLTPIAQNLDNLTRSILTIILLADSKIFNQEGDKLEKSFIDLLFSDKKIYGLYLESKPDYFRFRNVKIDEIP